MVTFAHLGGNDLSLGEANIMALMDGKYALMGDPTIIVTFTGDKDPLLGDPTNTIALMGEKDPLLRDPTNTDASMDDKDPLLGDPTNTLPLWMAKIHSRKIQQT